MHSWVFRNRLRLEQLYGAKKRVVDANILPVQQLTGDAPMAAQMEEPSMATDQLLPWPSVERTDAGIVVLHPSICGVPRIKRLPIYRRGA